MGLFRWNTNDDEIQTNQFIDFVLGLKSEQLAIKKFAIEHAIDLIAKTISKCEIKYYKFDEKIKRIIESKENETYYKLNIKPNKNEVATSFFYMVISSLLRENNALLVIDNEQLYFSRSFNSSSAVTKEKIYSDIELENSFGDTEQFNKKLYEKDVISLNLGNSQVKKVIDDFFEEYQKYINAASSNYKFSNIRKYRLKFPGTQPAMRDPKTKEEITYDEYKERITKGLFTDEEAILLLSEQFDLIKLNDDKTSTSEDLRNLMKKWSDDVAMAFNIPLDVFYGSKTDKSTGTNDFITFAIAPIISILEDNLNAKLIPKKNFLKGEKFVINKLNIKHFDIFDVAGPIDKLSANGFSHNDNREFLELPKIDEDWANEHRFTKNYADAKENAKGGDE